MNLIFSAFAAMDGFRENADTNRGREVYYRCIVVTLVSAKQQNPDCEVALVTNDPLPAPFDKQLARAGVSIHICPFDRFRFAADLPWSLAFYKLCAMDWVLKNLTFDHCVLLDTDTYTQYPFTDLWREADEAVLLYQVPHPASQPMAAAISGCCDALDPDGAPHVLTHFGGELIAGSAPRLRNFMELCRTVYEEMQARSVLPQDGDEVILCIAAWRALSSGQPVRAANAYIWRYWLGARHYFVSTNYCLVPICVLHLPGSGKDRQLKLLYRHYTKRGCFPDRKAVWRLCGLPAAHPPLFRTLWVRLQAALPD